ncbi:OLC1v1037008C1 [Oldenlandia corymbosa var. corymbosa]|uniref:OLC1v1037008C1 n=1 Tax=Oldenlandia corymbosa var. corymbosa TaxID=529605 RepID=A0AAV1CY35_OLDCO|nr:OLC1v1037008C1 [Oldenlandia corymbosa var. corymbosa]
MGSLASPSSSLANLASFFHQIITEVSKIEPNLSRYAPNSYLNNNNSRFYQTDHHHISSSPSSSSTLTKKLKSQKDFSLAPPILNSFDVLPTMANNPSSSRIYGNYPHLANNNNENPAIQGNINSLGKLRHDYHNPIHNQSPTPKPIENIYNISKSVRANRSMASSLSSREGSHRDDKVPTDKANSLWSTATNAASCIVNSSDSTAADTTTAATSCAVNSTVTRSTSCTLVCHRSPKYNVIFLIGSMDRFLLISALENWSRHYGTQLSMKDLTGKGIAGNLGSSIFLVQGQSIQSIPRITSPIVSTARSVMSDDEISIISTQEGKWENQDGGINQMTSFLEMGRVEQPAKVLFQFDEELNPIIYHGPVQVDCHNKDLQISPSMIPSSSFGPGLTNCQSATSIRNSTIEVDVEKNKNEEEVGGSQGSTKPNEERTKMHL